MRGLMLLLSACEKSDSVGWYMSQRLFLAGSAAGLPISVQPYALHNWTILHGFAVHDAVYVCVADKKHVMVAV